LPWATLLKVTVPLGATDWVSVESTRTVNDAVGMESPVVCTVTVSPAPVQLTLKVTVTGVVPWTCTFCGFEPAT